MIISNSNKTQDKLLFTPGPLTTASNVKEAGLRDLGSRDSEFISLVRKIRKGLLSLAHVDAPDYEAVIMQGSGTFGIESTISTVIPANGALLNIINGAYGRRISQMARIHSIPLIELEYGEDSLPDVAEIEEVLIKSPQITHISIIHGETTTGLLNPIEETGELAAKYNKVLIVDAMSTFGAYDIDMEKNHISYLVSSSNKCIEGIPGFSYVIGRGAELKKCKGQARTLSLDLYDQWAALESNGQFRFTPPVQSLLAFNKALELLEAEGGVAARAVRYARNNSILMSGMSALGFQLYLSPEARSYIITSFIYPAHPDFSFESFYSRLSDKGFVIYPGKLSKTDCFRIGNIGQLYPDDMHHLVAAVKDSLDEMKINLLKK